MDRNLLEIFIVGRDCVEYFRDLFGAPPTIDPKYRSFEFRRCRQVN